MTKQRKSRNKSIQRKSRNKRKSMKNIKNIVKMIDDRKYHDFPLNLLLVIYGARKAYLLETSEFHGKENDIEDMLTIAKENGLHIEKDPSSRDDAPRYWIYKQIDKIPETDEEIGMLLGFKEPGGDFFDMKRDRTTLHIYEKTTDIIITTELILDSDQKEIEDFARHKIARFNNVMVNLNLPFRFDYEIDKTIGTTKRIKELESGNMKYMIENEREYRNDFLNVLVKWDNYHPLVVLFSKVIHENNKKLFNKYLPIFLYVYQVLHEEIDFDEQINAINEKFVDLIISV